jgi:hypothetical protein
MVVPLAEQSLQMKPSLHSGKVPKELERIIFANIQREKLANALLSQRQ